MGFLNLLELLCLPHKINFLLKLNTEKTVKKISGDKIGMA